MMASIPVRPMPLNGSIYHPYYPTMNYTNGTNGTIPFSNYTSTNLTSALPGNGMVESRSIKHYAVPFAIVALVGMALFSYYLLRTCKDLYSRDKISGLFNRSMRRPRPTAVPKEDDEEEMTEKVIEYPSKSASIQTWR